MSEYECYCRRCSGEGPACYEGGEHDYGRDPLNANCRDCGEVNGPLLSYIGRVSKVAKRTGLSYGRAEALIELRQLARIAVAPRTIDETEMFRSWGPTAVRDPFPGEAIPSTTRASSRSDANDQSSLAAIATTEGEP